MAKYMLALSLFLVPNFLMCQKVIGKTIENLNITSLRINADNCFQVNISTSDAESFQIKALIDGEYQEDILLGVGNEGSTLFINPGVSPNFNGPNDKLSAHKVMSIVLNIELPENKKVQLLGTGCNLIAKGIYDQFKVRLNDGQCKLHMESGDLEVMTQSGDIDITSSGANIRTINKYGNVLEEAIPWGADQYLLSTVTGDIHLRKTK